MTASLDTTAAPPAAGDKLALALRYAGLGIPVFPLAPGCKVPRKGSRGHLDATTDAETIRAWFHDTPAMNWGAIGGAEHVGPGGEVERLVWVDLDRKGAKDGLRALDDACAAAGFSLADIDTFAVRTPSGGLHLGFYTPRRIRQGVDVLGPGSGVDIRSEGQGYVVGPGSTIDGAAYQIVNDVPIAPMGRLAELFPEGQAPTESAPSREPLPGIDPNRARDRALAILDMAPGAVEGQAGDLATLKLAMRLKDAGCTPDDALELMLEHWNDRCSPPWSEDELAAKVRNAFKYGAEVPGISAPEAVFDPVPQPDPVDTPAQPKRSAALEVVRWSDLKDKPITETRWILEPYFPRVTFGMLASHPGRGKSWLALQLCVAVATGLPVLGLPTCGPAGAGILALEDDQNVLHRRLKRIREAYGLAWTSAHDDLLDQNLVLMVRGRVAMDQLGKAAASHALGALAAELTEAMKATQGPPAVVFLDTLNSVHDGDENDNTAVRALAATVFSIGDTLGCSVWALHHFRKTGGSKGAPGLFDRMNFELVRGASALAGSARAIVQFGWLTAADTKRVELDANDPDRYAILGLTKINDGPRSPWLLVEHGEQGLLIPTLGGERALATLRGGGAVDALKKKDEILLDLHAGLLSRAELAAKHFPGHSKGGADKLKAIFQDMRRRDRWIEAGGMDLTKEGLQAVAEILGRQAKVGAYLDDAESED